MEIRPDHRIGVPLAARLIVPGGHAGAVEIPIPSPSGDMADGDVTAIWPPDVQCFAAVDGSYGYHPDLFNLANCTVSEPMVNYLNLTEIAKYVKAYCANPPRNDDCPFDFCPNPEIAGTGLIIHIYPLSLTVLPLRPAGADRK